MSTVSLEKKVNLVKQVLARRNVPEKFVLAVKSCIDISGSMEGMFRNGTVQELVDRLLAVAVRFDDNQSIESYAFGSGAVQLDDVTPAMFGAYVDRLFLPQAEDSGYLWSGTNYAKALRLVLKDTKPGMFSFRRQAKPSYLMFITDGETSDEGAAQDLIEQLGKHNTYVQLIGVGRGANFRFLDRMGERYSHVGFVTLPDIESMTDEQLYDALLTDELADWIRTR